MTASKTRAIFALALGAWLPAPAGAEPPAGGAPDPDRAPMPPPPPGELQRQLGLGLGVAGAISAGIAVRFGLEARSAGRDVSVRYDPDRERQGRSAERSALLFGVAGAAALAGGGLLYWLGYQETNAPRLSIGAGAGGVEAVVRGSF